MSRRRPAYRRSDPVREVQCDDDLFETLYCDTDLGYANPSSTPSLIELQVDKHTRQPDDNNFAALDDLAIAGGDALEMSLRSQNDYHSKYMSNLMIRNGLWPTREAQFMVQLITILLFLLLLIVLQWWCDKFY